jgi:predicted Zn-dependent protease
MSRRTGVPQSQTGRIIMGVIVAIIAVVSYFATTQEVDNPITGQTQRLALTQEEEIKLGLNAAPQMAQQFGGLAQAPEKQERLDRIGRQLVEATAAGDTPYEFEFHVLEDDQTINAFALPGGPVFITEALYDQLPTDAQLAGVLGHEIGHVVGRHASEQIAKAQLAQGLSAAAAIAAYDPEDPSSQQRAMMAQMAAQLATMRFSRGHELESDALGVRFLAEAGYDPRALVDVMNVLARAGGPNPPEFFSTHPNPENRIEAIQAAIEERYPNGVPADLEGGPDA